MFTINAMNFVQERLKTRSRTDYEWIEKNHFQKKSDKKKQKTTENQFQNAASENKNPLARNVYLILTKN